MVSKPEREKSNLILPIVIIGALLPIIGFGWWYLERESSRPTATPVLTTDAKSYVKNLKLSGVQMKATKNYTGAAIVEIEGNIANSGDRPLSLVELTCIFYDPYGQVVLRERVPIVRAPLNPGETKAFRMPFEGLPPSWNRSMPQLVIAQIKFAG